MGTAKQEDCTTWIAHVASDDNEKESEDGNGIRSQNGDGGDDDEMGDDFSNIQSCSSDEEVQDED